MHQIDGRLCVVTRWLAADWVLACLVVGAGLEKFGTAMGTIQGLVIIPGIGVRVRHGASNNS